jgi:DNA polymerase alpha subunit B
VALASTLHLTPEMMAEVWEAHSLNKQNLTELTMHQFEGYKNELIKASSIAPTPDIPQSSDALNKINTISRGAAIVSRKREAPPATMVTPTSSSKRQKQPSPDAATSSVDRLAMEGSNVPSPVRSNNTTAITSAIKITPPNLPKYEERTKVGHVVVSYPAGYRSENNTNTSNAGQRRCILTTKSLGDDNENGQGVDDVTRYNITESYRHMFTTLEDRANALQRQLVRTKDAIVEDIESERMNKKEAADDVVASFEEVNVPRQHPSTCVGRICNEAHNGKMNTTSVVLEGSSSSCGGARVNVDLSHMQKKEQQQQGYSLFPGQIVAIEGINGTGRKITATKVREGASLPPASSSAHAIRKYYCDDDTQEQPIAPLKVISACGPFTTAKSMDYAPFVDLMHVVLEETPDVVILMGPFVDARQEAVQSGRVTCDDEGENQDMVVDYETLFSQRIAAVIEEVFEEKSMETEFILIPALEDAIGKFV